MAYSQLLGEITVDFLWIVFGKLQKAVGKMQIVDAEKCQQVKCGNINAENMCGVEQRVTCRMESVDSLGFGRMSGVFVLIYFFSFAMT